MPGKRSIGFIASAVAIIAATIVGAAGGDDKPGQHQHHPHPGAGPAHIHAPVPAEYQQVRAPEALWTDTAALARGRAIYTAKCALCHGEQGAGDGPVAKTLPLKPASFKDTAMVAEMTDSFWFWRVSEGAAAEPYRSARSVMPAWKDELSVDDRWAVIAYQHSLSGHRGPHLPSEHPELRAAGAQSHPEFRGVAFTSQWVSRDHRAQPRGPWRYALRKELPALYREMNGIDFGHAHLGETLLKTQDAEAVERARLEVLDFIFSSPPVPPDEEQIAPNFSRLAPEVGKTFDWAHVFHRSLYDLFASDMPMPDKETAYRKLLADYLEKPEAITPHRLDHHQALWSFPESKSFRDRFRRFNTQIWAYHWLQASVYDVQLLGDADKQRELMPKIIAHYHGYLRRPPVEWQFMPMMPEGAPEFARRFPEAAAIFDNLHMLHDNFDDVLVRPDLYPSMAARREAILKVLPVYLHRSHGANDLYPDFHEAAAGGHGGHGGTDMGPRPPSAGDVLAGRVPQTDHSQPPAPTAPAGGHKH